MLISRDDDSPSVLKRELKLKCGFNELSNLKFMLLLILACNTQLVASFSVKETNVRTLQINANRHVVDRSSFLRNTFGVATIITLPNPTKAIEFVPASPFFTGSYKDAVEIVYTQRLALDNIATVINDGNLEEAGFKIMQLAAQTRTGGKIILDTVQDLISKSGDSVTLLRFLSCQKKFAILLDLCDECGTSLERALKGKLGTTTAAQIKTSSVVDETKNAYDDFLLDLKMVENIFAR